MNDFTPARADESQRLQQIHFARSAVMTEGRSLIGPGSLWQERSWIEQSWRRCLSMGHLPEHHVDFDVIAHEVSRRTEEAHHVLLTVAKPLLSQLGQAIATTRYFAILTDARGVVIEVDGVIDRSDARADAIARVGVDLSEESVGTSAIGAALHEHRNVWLHRGEHFFADTSVYSCAGAPLWSPQGAVMGMLDLTGVDAEERPELMHLAAQSARGIENAMVEALPYALIVRVNWPGMSLADVDDGLVALNTDGCVLGFNQAAAKIVSVTAETGHANDVFAMPFERLFDAAQNGKPCLDVPLWSGLRVNAAPLLKGHSVPRYAFVPQMPLRDAANNLIQQAIRETKGDVSEAARKLGISRATLYRKLAPPSKRHYP